MKTYFLDVILHQYADFEGRATRTQYWLFMLCNWIVAWLVRLPFRNDPLIQHPETIDFSNPIPTSSLIALCVILGYSLILLIPTIAIQTRRLHDIGRSGWWQLMAAIPVLGAVFLFICNCIPSVDQDNEY